ncbi:MAG: rRNA pseudouridine synthase [Deltaproteobacteria bacterium]|nr:rRNA pseudouridine synthase [Deltaproteobacteria bacterium]
MTSAKELVRIQKFLSMAGICSRREGERYVQQGRVKVNGKIITEPGSKVDPEKDRVEVDGKRVVLSNHLVYLALNKPKGYVSSCQQTKQKTVLELVNLPQRIYPVGRLDKDSTGLLLLTNDGRLHHRLLHPSFDHEKEYEVTVVKPIPNGALRKLAAGLPMMGTKTRPAEIKQISSKHFRIILKEGKNRQIRRMIRKVGNQVIRLHRIRVANIWLKDLPPGSWRYLNEDEKKKLLKTAGLLEHD